MSRYEGGPQGAGRKERGNEQASDGTAGSSVQTCLTHLHCLILFQFHTLEGIYLLPHFRFLYTYTHTVVETENMEISKINPVKFLKEILWLSCLKKTYVSILEGSR